MEAARQLYPDLTLSLPRPRIGIKETDARRFRFNKFVWALGLIGAAAFIHVYQQALVAQNGIDIARVKSEIKEEARLGKTLKVQRMILKSPSRLERLATKNLGMVKPAKVNYIVIPAELPDAPMTRDKTKKKGLGAVLARINFLVGP